MAGPVQFKPVKNNAIKTYDFPYGFAGGIDISESPDLIDANKSPDMYNENYDAGGVPTKRYGFAAVNATAWGTQQVRGMWEFEKPNGTLLLLVAWNGKLWSVAADGTKTDLCTGAKTSIADAQIDGFIFNDKFYFLTGTEFCVYDGTNPVALVTTTAYAPLAFINTPPAGGGEVNEAYNLLSNSYRQSFNGTADATAYKLSQAVDSIDWVKVGGVVTEITYTLGEDDVTVTFATALGAGQNNVEIKGTKSGLKDSTIITKCKFHCIYGGQNDARVFFSGNPTYRNYRFQSGLMDVTYFPDDGDQNMPNSDAEAVTGMGKMGNYMVTLTEHQRFWTDVTADESTVAFTINPLNDQYGCCSWRTVALAQDGLLALSYEGVTWTSTTGVRSQLNTKMISKAINRGIDGITGLLRATRAEMEAAYAYIYRNKYHLHVGATTWVLDLDYTILAQGVYCWYPYTGLYSTLTQMVERQDGLLWAGDSAGKVYKSHGYYNDAGVDIDAWWKCPNLFMGSRGWVKKFLNIKFTFKAEQISDHTLTIYTNEDIEDIPIRQEAGIFSYANFSYKYWTYGVINKDYPSQQTEKAGYKGEYIQIKMRNNTARGMTIVGIAITYQVIKEAR